MTLVVETGAGLADAESYGSVAGASAYHIAQGNVGWTPTDDAAAEVALRRATRYVDGWYRSLFSGQRLRQRDQALEWPRVNAVADCFALPSDAVPREVQEATFEAALRELVSPGSLTPDTDQFSAIQSVTAGSVSVTLSAGAGGSSPGTPTLTAVDLLLAPLLGEPQALVGRVGRG